MPDATHGTSSLGPADFLRLGCEFLVKTWTSGEASVETLGDYCGRLLGTDRAAPSPAGSAAAAAEDATPLSAGPRIHAMSFLYERTPPGAGGLGEQPVLLLSDEALARLENLLFLGTPLQAKPRPQAHWDMPEGGPFLLRFVCAYTPYFPIVPLPSGVQTPIFPNSAIGPGADALGIVPLGVRYEPANSERFLIPPALEGAWRDPTVGLLVLPAAIRPKSAFPPAGDATSCALETLDRWARAFVAVQLASRGLGLSHEDADLLAFSYLVASSLDPEDVARVFQYLNLSTIFGFIVGGDLKWYYLNRYLSQYLQPDGDSAARELFKYDWYRPFRTLNRLSVADEVDALSRALAAHHIPFTQGRNFRVPGLRADFAALIAVEALPRITETGFDALAAYARFREDAQLVEERMATGTVSAFLWHSPVNELAWVFLERSDRSFMRWSGNTDAVRFEVNLRYSLVHALAPPARPARGP